MILHLFGWDKKFVAPFIDFVGEHFAMADHRFIIYGEVRQEDVPQRQNVIFCQELLKNPLLALAEMRAARKIILHGLFSSHLLYLLMLQPWLLKKCYWTIWGGDLYVHEAENRDWRWRKNEFIRRFVISRLGHFITQIQGDYELAQKFYGAKGHWHKCFMYPSNLYCKNSIASKAHDGTYILLGNSASPSNHHLDALEKLQHFATDDIRIYCPLSYGEEKYGDKVAKLGKSLFGEKFIPLRDFMPLDSYINLLATIDIAIFNHNRQQGMGNITSLLGLGKKVYLRSSISTWDALRSRGLQIYDIDFLCIEKIKNMDAKKNEELIKIEFSKANLINKLCEIFG